MVEPGEELEEGVWRGASAQSWDGAGYGSLSDHPERGTCPASELSPQTPSPCCWCLVVKHSFLGCLTFCSLGTPQDCFQAQYRKKLLGDEALLGVGCVWGADDDPLDSYLLGELGEQMVTEVAGLQGL